MGTIRCPNCRKTVGGESTEGGLRVRVGIVLLDPETGLVKGPCPHCKEPFVISKGGVIAKAIELQVIVPAFRMPRG